jgi:hypothetical protein
MGWPVPADTTAQGPWLLAAGLADDLAAQVPQVVGRYRQLRPLEPGPPGEVLRRALERPDTDLLPAVVRSRYVLRDGRVVDGAATLPPEVQRAVDVVRARLAGDPFAAPEAPELAVAGVGPRELGAAVRLGQLIRVADGVYLAPDVAAEARARRCGRTRCPPTAGWAEHRSSGPCRPSGAADHGPASPERDPAGAVSTASAVSSRRPSRATGSVRGARDPAWRGMRASRWEQDPSSPDVDRRPAEGRRRRAGALWRHRWPVTSGVGIRSEVHLLVERRLHCSPHARTSMCATRRPSPPPLLDTLMYAK